MKPAIFLLAGAVVLVFGVAVYGMYSVSEQGAWPRSWPEELEPLREQSTTYVGPILDQQHHMIPFTRREDFEAAWPHLLKVKSPGAPLFLVQAPHEWLGRIDAGVSIHCPPPGTDKQANPEKPVPGDRSERSRWMWTNYLVLVVDGEIVDLNRIPLPADTPIIDERFKPPLDQAQPAGDD